MLGDDGLDNKLLMLLAWVLVEHLGFVCLVALWVHQLVASAGKAATDGIQGMFFGGTEKEKKLAEALALLEGGRI